MTEIKDDDDDDVRWQECTEGEARNLLEYGSRVQRAVNGGTFQDALLGVSYPLLDVIYRVASDTMPKWQDCTPDEAEVYLAADATVERNLCNGRGFNRVPAGDACAIGLTSHYYRVDARTIKTSSMGCNVAAAADKSVADFMRVAQKAQEDRSKYFEQEKAKQVGGSMEENKPSLWFVELEIIPTLVHHLRVNQPISANVNVCNKIRSVRCTPIETSATKTYAWLYPLVPWDAEATQVGDKLALHVGPQIIGRATILGTEDLRVIVDNPDNGFSPAHRASIPVTVPKEVECPTLAEAVEPSVDHQGQLNSLYTGISTLHLELDEQSKKIADKDDEIADLKCALQNAREKAASVSPAVIDNLRDIVEKQRDELKKLTDERDVGRIKSRLRERDLRAHIKELEDEVAAAKLGARLSGQSRDVMEEAYEKARKLAEERLANIERVNERSRSMIEDRDGMLSAWKTKYDAIAIAEADVRSELAARAATEKSLRKRIQELESAAATREAPPLPADTDESLIDWEGHFNDVSKDLKRTADAYETVSGRAKDLQKKYDDEQQACANLRCNLKQLGDDLTGAHRIIGDLRREVARLKGEVVEALRDGAGAAMEIDVRVESLTDQIEKLKLELFEANDAVVRKTALHLDSKHAEEALRRSLAEMIAVKDMYMHEVQMWRAKHQKGDD